MSEYAALISPYHWSSPAVTFSFMQTAPSYLAAGDPIRSTFSPVNAALQNYITGLLNPPSNGSYASSFSDVSGLTFSLSSGVGQIDIGSAITPNGRANGQYPLPTQEGGDIFLPTTMASAPAPGSYDHMAIMHEIGHAVGLEHGGAYAGGGTPPSLPNLSAAFDNRSYTIMSYNPDPNAASGSEPLGLQQLDIAALQSLYGVNYSTRSDDTIYTFTTSPGIITLWDGGGHDMIDASGFAQRVTINLQPGAFSSIGGNQNVAMSLVDHLPTADRTRPLIEDAIGGSGNDDLIGNDATNVLMGGEGTNKLYGMGGDDLLYAEGTQDILEGGAGNDILSNLYGDGQTQYVFAGGYGHDWVDDNPYFENSGIDVFLRDLAPSDVDLVVERWDASAGSGTPYYIYDDVYLKIKATGDTLLLPWLYRPESARDEPMFDYAGDTIQFGTGSAVWNMQNLESYATFDGLMANDPTVFAFEPSGFLV